LYIDLIYNNLNKQKIRLSVGKWNWIW